ncbi:hypothetical protein R6Z07M_014529 [Ovis aries]
MSPSRGRDRAPPPPPPPPPPLLLLPPRRLLLLQTLLLRGAPRRALRHQRPARLLPSAAPSGLARGLRGGRRWAGGTRRCEEPGSLPAGRPSGRPREAGCPTHSGGSMRGRSGSWGALSRRAVGLRGARGQRSGAGARGGSTNASRPLRPGACRLMSPPPRLSGRAHRRLPPLAAAGAFSTRGRRGGGGPGAGPGPSRHNEDAGPGGSPLGARPDGRSARLGAPRPHQRRPCRLAGLPRPLHCRRLFSWRSGWEGGAQTLGDGTGSSEGAEPARLELMSAGSRRNSAPGRNDQRHGAKDAKTGPAAVPQNAVRCRMSFLTHIRPRTHTHQRLSGEQGEGGSGPTLGAAPRLRGCSQLGSLRGEPPLETHGCHLASPRLRCSPARAGYTGPGGASRTLVSDHSRPSSGL